MVVTCSSRGRNNPLRGHLWTRFSSSLKLFNKSGVSYGLYWRFTFHWNLEISGQPWLCYRTLLRVCLTNWSLKIADKIASSFRPISTTGHIGKLFERMIERQLRDSGRFGDNIAADVSATTLSPNRLLKAKNKNEIRGTGLTSEEWRLKRGITSKSNYNIFKTFPPPKMGSYTAYRCSPSPSQRPAPTTIAGGSPFPLGLCSCSTPLRKIGTEAAPRGRETLEEMGTYPRHVSM